MEVSYIKKNTKELKEKAYSPSSYASQYLHFLQKSINLNAAENMIFYTQTF